VPLPEQDRARWDAAMIAEGEALVDATIGHAALGPYQVQAAIAALHATAPSTEETDWAQIVELYRVLQTLMPSPVVTINQAVAVAQASGPARGLELLDTVDAKLDVGRRLDAVRAHLLELAGDLAVAREHYLRAAERTASLPERRYLMERAARIAPGAAGGTGPAHG
jgi:predicted RNA polymerase sigma factor